MNTKPFCQLPALLGGVLMLWSAGQSMAWGPHPEITQAAVDTLGSDAPIARELGPELKRLRDYCWMADWRRQLHREAGAWFYTDDYLLFPRMTTHRDHLCPEVKQTYEPYFRRALQALRTETPVNAVRWIGSIIHFTEDTGSPPHAAGIRGDVHSKMENWVDAKAITIDGYYPQSFGATDGEAVAGFLRRMDGLIAFSKERAERAKPFVVNGDRAATEPIVLESALECSRIVADLLCTLGKLAAEPAGDGASLQGMITSIAAPGLEKVAAKVALVGTPFSTIADSEGHYVFHGLSAKTYQIASWRPGSAVTTASAAIVAHQTTTLSLDLSAETPSGNLIRNGALDLIWLGSAQPDDWYPVKSRIDGPHWEGEIVPLEKGRTYRLEVSWQDRAAGQVVVRLRKSGDFSQLPTDSKPLTPGETKLEFPSEGGFAQVLLYCVDAPSKLVKHVALSAAP